MTKFRTCKILPFITLPLAALLCACQTYNHVTFDSSYSTNKNWLEIVSDKKDFEGKQADSCYKLNLKFLPEEAKKRLETDYNCITRCCWRSAVPELTIDTNLGLEDELYEKGKAYKYSPGKITIRVKYSSILGLTTASVTPAGAISYNGTVKLKYTEVYNNRRQQQLYEQELGRQEAAAGAAVTSAIRKAEEDRIENERVQQASRHYNFKKSIDYVKLFQNYNIDKFLSELDKEQEQKGYILLLGVKNWEVSEKNDLYTVSCTTSSKRGKSQNSMKDYPLECGVWEVDLNTPSVTPKNALAKRIAAAN